MYGVRIGARGKGIMAVLLLVAVVATVGLGCAFAKPILKDPSRMVGYVILLASLLGGLTVTTIQWSIAFLSQADPVPAGRSCSVCGHGVSRMACSACGAVQWNRLPNKRLRLGLALSVSRRRSVLLAATISIGVFSLFSALVNMVVQGVQQQDSLVEAYAEQALRSMTEVGEFRSSLRYFELACADSGVSEAACERSLERLIDAYYRFSWSAPDIVRYFYANICPEGKERSESQECACQQITPMFAPEAKSSDSEQASSAPKARSSPPVDRLDKDFASYMEAIRAHRESPDDASLSRWWAWRADVVWHRARFVQCLLHEIAYQPQSTKENLLRITSIPACESADWWDPGFTVSLTRGLDKPGCSDREKLLGSRLPPKESSQDSTPTRCGQLFEFRDRSTTRD